MAENYPTDGLLRRSLLLGGLGVLVTGVIAACSGANQPPQSSNTFAHTATLTVPSETSTVIPTEPSETPTATKELIVNIDDLDTQGLSELEGLKETLPHGSELPDALMHFSSAPQDSESAREQAAYDANYLLALANTKMSPIIIFEPPVEGNFEAGARYIQAVSSGDKDEALRAYFDGLKEADVTAEMLGKFDVAPEMNVPVFSAACTPKELAAYAVRIASIQQEVFPGSESSVLFNSTTCSPGDVGWENPQLQSLVPFGQAIHDATKASGKELKWSLGIQTMPWLDSVEATKSDAARVSETLQLQSADDIFAAAKAMGANSIWFNTGAFGQRRLEDGTVLKVPASERAKILSHVTEVAATITRKKMPVTVSLFAENKLSTDEAIDWSFVNDPGLLAEVLKNVRSNKVNVGFFTSSGE